MRCCLVVVVLRFPDCRKFQFCYVICSFLFVLRTRRGWKMMHGRVVVWKRYYCMCGVEGLVVGNGFCYFWFRVVDLGSIFYLQHHKRSLRYVWKHSLVYGCIFTLEVWIIFVVWCRSKQERCWYCSDWSVHDVLRCVIDYIVNAIYRLLFFWLCCEYKSLSWRRG